MLYIVTRATVPLAKDRAESGMCLPYRVRRRFLGSRRTTTVDLLAAEGVESYPEGMVREEDDFYQGQRRNRWSRKTAEEWQRQWDIADKGRWTHRIIPCLVEWTERRHGLVTFHFTQVLTGHSQLPEED